MSKSTDYLDKLPIIPPLKTENKYASIIALDLGRRCGWAYKTKDGQTDSGVHEVYDPVGHIQRFEDGIRFKAFRDFVHTLDQQIGQADIIAFEQVHGGTKGHQSVMNPGYRAVLMAWAADQGKLVVPLAVGTIKRAACGKGNATKDEVIAAVRERAGVAPFDDNEADAVAIRDFALPMAHRDQRERAEKNVSRADAQGPLQNDAAERATPANRPRRKKAGGEKYARRAARKTGVQKGVIRGATKGHAEGAGRARKALDRNRRGEK